MTREEAATQVTFHFTDGLVGGEVIQFADGRWPGVVGGGIAISEEGFDLIEPHLRAAAPGWTSDHRYGVFELTAPARQELARRLMVEVAALPDADAEALLFKALATWLEQRLDGWKPVGVFGI
ncbi:hypothetical protein ASD21_12300 [Caulobacter sp. Root1455]|uniref:hypothetical protein n=1 Tax=Caulobacter sp. Root1455 TaxID=1736465 RepID=UPI0006F24C0D|nr:hypothetical protein [Caulobacter sp. Root1455]KQY92205.1 hypothetical protein ASD21_12300 [Caulobacter sp. Root1455]